MIEKFEIEVAASLTRFETYTYRTPTKEEDGILHTWAENLRDNLLSNAREIEEEAKSDAKEQAAEARADLKEWPIG